jgi:hypothetical protein
MQPTISEPTTTRSLGFYAGLDLGQAAEYTALENNPYEGCAPHLTCAIVAYALWHLRVNGLAWRKGELWATKRCPQERSSSAWAQLRG